ncbi:probable LRR receptor-like serine/threonine-protein kinase At4g36180 [Prunus avium]|uniref:Probable LRR receptor-like serine/threonine-protein kinase At4g36180 n=1 Tax=Prunus avium TaxID=42229 RepID=A0A6P5SJB6_PRUAV|nr:probable LRR receptor-like serine/threonine-protein kinase At4g36180 [Prunus avium]
MQGHGRCLKLFLAFALLLLQYAQGGEVDHSQRDTNVPRRCIEKERQALLAFKHGLVDEDNSLSSWGSEAQKQDCCRWIGVYCSYQTGHVIGLDLSFEVVFDNLQGTMISPKLFELQHLQHLDLTAINFNGSQFPNFIGSLTNLRYLDLSWTNFGGKFPSQVGNLTNLVYLDLSVNSFTNVENLNWLPPLLSLRYLDLSSVNLSNAFDWLEAVNKLPELTNLTLRYCDLPPPILSTLSYINFSQSLASADLSGNDLSTSSIFLWLSNYNASLVYLDLSANQLVGSIPDVLGNMSSLTHLDLQSNQFEGGVPHSFARLCSLQYLGLSSNNLSGQLSKFVQILLSTCAQNSLEMLDLGNNQLAGSLPDLTNLSSLESLTISYNQLSGGIPESIGLMSKLEYIDFRMNSLEGIPESIGLMSKLVYIDFSMNSLEGVISKTHFSKLSKLRYLGLSSNKLVLDIHADWIPPFQLGSIHLRSCKMGPDFPKWLQTQKEFSHLDISDAGISDSFPSWFWSLCRNVTFMNLTSNQIRGTFANLTLEFSDFPTLLLSSNKLEGPIPSFLSTTKHLDLSYNKLSGSISFLCSSAAINLGFLDLSNNNVSGQVPDCLTHLESLVMLDLSNNALSGKIPTTIGSMFRIETLKLRSNRFVGQLPSSLKNCTSLVVIDVGDNKLSGPIPEWLGVSLKKLVILMLSSNHFNGSLPSQLCHLTHIQILDFSMNIISGSIPKCLTNLTTLAQKGNPSLNISHSYIISNINWGDDYDDDATFMWKGGMQTYKSTLGLVKRIDMSSNKLTGDIPSEITHLVGLVSLNLSRNQLTGQITPEIGNLQSLDSLDLSQNHIDGRIPTSLARIDRLGFLDLSYNNLFGKIPVGTQLQGFDPSFYAGNLQLCGPPLKKMCVDEVEKGPSGQTDFINQGDKDELITLGFYISMGLGFAAGFWGVCGTLIFSRSWRYAYLKFLNGLNDWLFVRIALLKRQLKGA